jgi:hypothetical protein
MLHIELWETTCKFSSLPVDNISKRDNQEIEFNYLIQTITVDVLL